MTNLSKKKFVDLHLHSIYSEGTLGIPKLIQEAKKLEFNQEEYNSLNQRIEFQKNKQEELPLNTPIDDKEKRVVNEK